jgi:prepilin-type N-terminal cleavage/methylation domain-containing protein
MKSKGFTIVEVLVVIGIIAILTVIIFPSISNIRAKNRDAEKVADISAIQLGLSLYKNQQNGEYPKTLQALLDAKYITEDSFKTPAGEEYIYVPLTRDTSGQIKCTYYHLGVQLEMPSAQIDTADKYTSKKGEDISNGYKYCEYSGEGIDINIENMYAVHP